MNDLDIAIGEPDKKGERKVVAVRGGRCHLDKFDPSVAWRRTKFAEAAAEALGLDPEEVVGIAATIATEAVKADLAAASSARDKSEAPANSPPPEPWQPFPTGDLFERLAEFVRVAARSIGCDESFLALPALAAVAAAIGTTRRVLLKSGWAEPLCIWAAIVGESGSQKTPAFAAVVKPFKRRQAELLKSWKLEREGYEADLAEYDKALTEWKKGKGGNVPPTKPDPPPIGRVIVSDATVESLGPILQQNRRGVLLARDELAGWLDFGRYDKSGKGSGVVSHWLSWFNSQATVIDRRTNPEPLFIPEASVGIVGGVQPRVLDRCLGGDHRENGLAARLLLACPPRRPKCWTDHGLPAATEERFERLLERLFDLRHVVDEDGEPQPVLLTLDRDAKRLWVEFVNRHGRESAELSGDEAAAFAKFEAYGARLAGVLHLIRWADDDALDADVIDADTMAAALRLVEWFKRETLRVYRVLRESDEERDRRRLVEWITNHGGSGTVREVQRGNKRFETADDAAAALHDLAAAGLGEWADEPPGEAGGRPTRRFVLTNYGDSDTTPQGPTFDEVLSPAESDTDADEWETP